MKRLVLITLITAILMFIVSCGEKTVYINNPLTPATPTGLTSISGDGLIELMWYPVDMANIDEYAIYWAPGGVDPTDESNYEYMASVSASRYSYTDYDVTNGTTYYYTIAAFNTSGESSNLSNYAMDTPRPEGHNVRLYDYNQSSTYDSSGYDLYYDVHVPYDDDNCDIFAAFSSTFDCFFLVVSYDEYYIQDYGYVEQFDDIGYAPPDGWSNFVDVEAIEGHMYMLKLNHFGEWHYAKIWVTFIDETPGNRYITFSWAYQTDSSNRELSIGAEQVMQKDENSNFK